MTDLELGKSKFRQALLEISKNYLENLELAPQEDIFFSHKLERKMSHLIKSPRKSVWHCFNTPLKKTLAACLAIVIFASAIMGCCQIREPIVEFFTEVYEQFTEFFFRIEDKEAASKVIEEVHMPTYVPEGYQLMENICFTNEMKEVCTVWENENGDKIFLYQNVLTDNLILDTENATLTTIDSDSKIAIIQKDNHTSAFWNDRTYSYLLVCNLSTDELIKIVKSIK
jgi:hypothetical protein